MADLARALDVDPRQSGPAALPPPAGEGDMVAFCFRRSIQPTTLERFGVCEGEHNDRPCLIFPTRCGVNRLKFLDGKKPKATWAQSGGGAAAHPYGLPEALELLEPGGRLYLVNGEPSVWAAAQAGVPAVCSAAGELAPGPEMITALAGAGVGRVAVVFDRDDAGRGGARKAVEALKEAGLDAVALELPADLGQGGDVDDLHRRTGDAGLAQALEALPELGDEIQTASGHQAEEWPEPGDLPAAVPPVPHMPPDLLPDAVRPYLEDAADRASLPLEMIATPWLVVTSSVIGRGVGIKPEGRDDWTVIPNLWGGIVVPPGSLKTHALTVALKLINPLIERSKSEFEDAQAAAEIERARLENELAQLTKGKNASRGDPAEIAALRRELKNADPSPKRFSTNDSTVEKLAELLAHNPRGMLLHRDEVAGWARTLERPGREGDREFFLEAWNGTGSFTVDRIGRGTIHAPALCLSILGGVQPGKLKSYVNEATSDGVGADGLLQRFQALAWPDDLGEFRRPDRWPDNDARRRSVNIMERLSMLDPLTAAGAELGEFDEVPVIRWSPPAQELFDDWRDRLERRLRGRELNGFPAFESYVGKQRSFMPSLALILDLADRVSGLDPGTGVSLRSAQRAAALVEFFEAHARKVYAVEVEPNRAAGAALAQKIRAGEIGHQDTVRDIVRAQWSGLNKADLVRAGLTELETIGWCRVAKLTSTGGRPSEVVELNPKLRDVAP